MLSSCSHALFHQSIKLRTIKKQKKNMFQWYAGLGEVPLWSEMCLFFPLRVTSCHVFTSAVGKIDSDFHVHSCLYLTGDLPPRQCSQRSCESMPSVFYLFKSQNFTLKVAGCLAYLLYVYSLMEKAAVSFQPL